MRRVVLLGVPRTHGTHGTRGTLERLLISQVSKGLGHLSDSVKTVSPHY